jgi:hypothetical protein
MSSTAIYRRGVASRLYEDGDRSANEVAVCEALTRHRCTGSGPGGADPAVQFIKAGPSSPFMRADGVPRRAGAAGH